MIAAPGRAIATNGNNVDARPHGCVSHAQQGIARRQVLWLLTGLAAATGGAWLGVRQWRADPASSTTTPDALPANASQDAATTGANSASDAPLIQGDALTAAFWQQAFDAPEGPPLALAALKGQPMLINFWATWCPPCVKEMPELDRFAQEFAPLGWQVIGLAIDGPTPVKAFLAKVRVGFRIGLAGFGGTELAQALGNQSGGLPFTVLIDAQGRVRHRKMGATSHAELAAWARGMKAS